MECSAAGKEFMKTVSDCHGCDENKLNVSQNWENLLHCSYDSLITASDAGQVCLHLLAGWSVVSVRPRVSVIGASWTRVPSCISSLYYHLIENYPTRNRLVMEETRN